MTLFFFGMLALFAACLIGIFALASIAVESWASRILHPLDAEWKSFERARLELIARSGGR